MDILTDLLCDLSDISLAKKLSKKKNEVHSCIDRAKHLGVSLLDEGNV